DQLARRLRDMTRDTAPMLPIEGQFLIDLHPVTNRRYAAFVKETGRAPPRHWHGGSPPEELLDHPVVWVTWHDASEYAAWCGRRLPTSEEWRAAAQGVDERMYPWGDEPDPKNCNCKESGFGTTTPVGQYALGASPYGIHDIGGNVAEWVAGAFTSKEGQTVRMVCGGSFKDPLKRSRCDARRGYPEGGKDAHVGFRCAKDAEQA
ncbi:MAG: formylglycine-generating enzyme family protein, partial [Planctomycetota bacterium]